MSNSKKEEKQSKEELFTDADARMWHELRRKTAQRARSLGVISDADIERIIAEVRRQKQNP